MSNDKFLRPEEAIRLLKVTHATLINWDKTGKLQAVRTKGGHRRYLESSILSNDKTFSFHFIIKN